MVWNRYCYHLLTASSNNHIEKALYRKFTRRERARPICPLHECVLYIHAERNVKSQHKRALFRMRNFLLKRDARAVILLLHNSSSSKS